MIEEIAPFYSPEAIEEFRDKVRRAKEKVQVIEKKKALKNNVKSFEVITSFYQKDPRKLFALTQNDITQKLAELLEKKGPFKFSVTLQVNLKKGITENDPRVQKLIEEIAPFYSPEAIEEFRDKVRRAKEKVQVIEKKKALKNNVKSFEVITSFYQKDPRKLFALTQNDITQKLAELLEKKGPFKFSVTLQVNLKKGITENGKDLENPILTLRLSLL